MREKENRNNCFFEILIMILIFLNLIMFVKIMPVEPYDELWNFQNVVKMYNGYQIYSDANIIITPLFFYIALFLLKIFGTKFIVFRIYNVIMILMYLFLVFMILKELKVSKNINFVMVSFIWLLVSKILNGGANYNFLAIIFVLFGMLIKFKFSKNKLYDYIQGIVIFLVFLSKQNIGIYYACALFLYEFIYRENFRQYCIKTLKKVVVFSLLILLFLMKLNIEGNLYNFFNYTFGGILEFEKNNKGIAVSLDLLFYCFAAIICVIAVHINDKKECFNIFKENIDFLLYIAVFMSFMCYPIFNDGHMQYLLVFYLLIWFYFLDYIMIEKCFEGKKTKLYCNILSCVLLFAITINYIAIYLTMDNDFIKIENRDSKYYSLYVHELGNERIKELISYIERREKENVKVVILSYEAAIVMSELDKSNGEFDLPFVGNLGFAGENGLINKIENMKNTEVLIFTDETDCFWQESKKVRKYIINNLNKIGEILNYSIYECK